MGGRILGAMLLTGLLPLMAAGQDAELYAPSVWDLKLGAHALELPRDEFIDYACGTRGGPPSLPLSDWSEFHKCRAEADTGLREVYFKYDDQPEYWAKARNLENQIALHQYTSAYAIPVIASALFDADGFLRGFRLVSDPRVDVRVRELGASLGGYLMSRYATAPWDCEDLPRAKGEREYQSVFLKRRCIEADPSLDLFVEMHTLRKPGQFAINPADGMPMEGQFESTTFFQALLRADIADRAARLASLATRPPTEKDVLVQRTRDCPGCDLRGANLKRANLAGANLAGANLTEANLHGAILTGANLSGAILEHANINRADLKRVNLRGADLSGAMLYESHLDAADLSGAQAVEAMAGKLQLIGATVANANFRQSDLRGARLNDANFAGADLSASLLQDAVFTRANLSGVKLTQSILLRASLIGVDLSKADARAVDFYGANLRDANLSGADLSYSRLLGANLTAVQTAGAKFIQAQLPAGFVPN